MTAYYLTRAGVSDVVIIEREGVASGASGYSAGMLTPYSGSNDPGLLALSGASLKLHAELAEDLPQNHRHRSWLRHGAVSSLRLR